ncbi:MAG: hypothetical protein ACRDYC_05785, partial [Acidimicrobiales bacterium]
MAGATVFDELPPFACWRHRGLRTGFEVAYFDGIGSRLRIQGTTTGVEDGSPWVVTYDSGG